MLQNVDIRRDLVIAWRLAVAIALAQLLGGMVLLLAHWPTTIPSMPGIPLAPARFWLGAAFASPLGMLIGVAWQRSSGAPSPAAFTSFCAVACLVLPLAGVALLTL